MWSYLTIFPFAWTIPCAKILGAPDINRYVTDGVKDWAICNKKLQAPTIQAAMVGEIIVYHYVEQSQENTPAR
jgi:hypothetical protein